MKRELGAAGLGALAIMAVMGWTRSPQPTAAVPLEQAISVPAVTTAYAMEAPVEYPMPRAGVRVQPSQASTARTSVPARRTAQQTAKPAAETSPAAERRDDDLEVKETRSTKKSVVIVAGGAAAGAAIGGLAGGKKGAAIGAISGAGAGLIYDRMTKNKGDKIF